VFRFDPTRLFQVGKEVVATAGNSGLYDIYRLDYTAPDQLGVLHTAEVSALIDPSSSLYAQPKIPGVEYYSIFSEKFSNFREGDYFELHTPDGISPRVTVVNKIGIKQETVGIRTNKIGSIGKTRTSLVYQNILFDFFGVQNPQPGLSDEEASTPFEQTRAVIYERTGLKNGMWLVEADGTTWKIVEINGTTPILALTLEKGGAAR
jgi:hypothetical protein